MDKKAMPIGQVFIFIIAIITFGLIMVFGYKAVQEFIDKGEIVEYITFKSNLEGKINKITTDYGSVSIEIFRLPGKYEKVCFVDMDYLPDAQQASSLKEASAFAFDSFIDANEAVKAGRSGYDIVSENVFLEPRFEDTAPIKTNRLKISSPDGIEQKLFECFKVQGGQFQITLEGKGDATEVSAPLG